MPSPGPPVWKHGVRADYYELSEEEKQPFITLLEEYGDLFATGDDRILGWCTVVQLP